MVRRAAVLTLATLALTAAPARATVPTGNLVSNPGAEDGTGTTDDTSFPPPGWTATGAMTAGQYGADGFPAAPDDGGRNLFAGGQNSADSTAEQTIDVGQAATEIDAGQVTVALSALLGGFSSQDDYATVTVRFLDASGGQLGLIAVGPVTPADRDDVTELLPRATESAVPGGTRALRVTLDSVRVEGSYDDGYADNVSVSLSATTGQPAATPSPSPSPEPLPAPAPTATPTPTPQPTFHQDVVVQPSGTVKVRKPGANAFVTVSSAAEIPLGSTVDTTRGAVVLSSVPKPGADPQHARFSAGVFKVTQPGGVTQLTLNQPLAACGAHASAAAKKPKTRKLWGDGHGAFRTTGQFSSATVRGTHWLVQDSCAGTLTRVASGVVAVRDDVRHKTFILRSGKQYLARPRHR